MSWKVKLILLAQLFVLIFSIIVLVRPKARAAGSLAIYGCAEESFSVNTAVRVCRVYDPETGKHYIVSTVYSLHGDGIAMTEGWRQ